MFLRIRGPGLGVGSDSQRLVEEDVVWNAINRLGATSGSLGLAAFRLWTFRFRLFRLRVIRVRGHFGGSRIGTSASGHRNQQCTNTGD